jgi:hypothetical protein
MSQQVLLDGLVDVSKMTENCCESSMYEYGSEHLLLILWILADKRPLSLMRGLHNQVVTYSF